MQAPVDADVWSVGDLDGLSIEVMPVELGPCCAGTS